jgi:drug/metabolite transporter (DMT)-like permease
MRAAIRSSAKVQGVLCLVLGMVALSFQDSLIKKMSGDYPLHEIILGRACVAILLTAFFAHLEGGLALLRTRRLPLHLARGVLLVIANVCYFLALAAMPLAEAAAIFFIAPLFITMLSVPFLGERVGPWRWAAVFTGLGGVVVMLRPGDGLLEIAAVLPIGAALAYAIMQILTRRLGVTERASALAFYVQLCFIVVSAVFGLFAGDGRFAGSGHPSVEFLLRAWSWPSGIDAVLILTCGFLIGTAAYLLSQAYRIAEANLLAPFEYTALPLAVLWGVLWWGDWPDATAFLGIALIVGSGLLVFYRETLHGQLFATRRPVPRNR